MNKLLSFKKMHAQEHLLLLANVWDTHSARIIEKVGFQAIATSSAGIADYLGYKDGENISFSTLYKMVKAITSAVSVPVSVDIESGYSEENYKIIEHVIRLADLGVTGINIEDSFKGNKTGLKNICEQAELLNQIKHRLDNQGYKDFFVNARIDTYLQGYYTYEDTLERSKHYIESGADGIFVPGIQSSEEIRALAAAINVPLNVMSLPGLTDADTLYQLGVRRFSIGNALADANTAFIGNVTNFV